MPIDLEVWFAVLWHQSNHANGHCRICFTATCLDSLASCSDINRKLRFAMLWTSSGCFGQMFLFLLPLDYMHFFLEERPGEGGRGRREERIQKQTWSQGRIEWVQDICRCLDKLTCPEVWTNILCIMAEAVHAIKRPEAGRIEEVYKQEEKKYIDMLFVAPWVLLLNIYGLQISIVSSRIQNTLA